MVPKSIRDRIWAHYRAGQCDDWNPSTAYCEAARDAVIAIAQREGKVPDTKVYDFFLRREKSDLDATALRLLDEG
jgi:hypothetical protein